MGSIEEIKKIFEREFWPIAGKFDILSLKGQEAWDSNDLRVARPGVYVWWKDNKVIKVGRHLTNARKRAIEHIRDDTGKRMATLKGDDNVCLVLFTVRDIDCHWAAALEIYFETELNPEIKSKRQG